MLAFDLETTGLDYVHGCLPFSFAAASSDGTVYYKEWVVDPYTRQPIIDDIEDYHEILDLLCSDEVVGHNIKFDLHGIDYLGIYCDSPYRLIYDWRNIHDTLVASHLFHSDWPHGLKPLGEILLGIPSSQKELQEAVNEARRIVRKKAFVEKYGQWRIANKEDPHFPAVKQRPKAGWGVMDYWLLKAICVYAPEFLPEEEGKTPETHSWQTLCKRYNIEDAIITLCLWDVFYEYIDDRGLWPQYWRRHDLLEVTYRMEQVGISIKDSIEEHERRYQREAELAKAVAEGIGRRQIKTFDNLDSPTQLRKLFFSKEGFNIPPTHWTKGGKSGMSLPSVDAAVIWEVGHRKDVPPQAKDFCQSLMSYRTASKAAGYLESYRRWCHAKSQRCLFGNPKAANGPAHAKTATKDNPRLRRRNSLVFRDEGIGEYKYIHPTINITGTKFTRQSTSQPNCQNIGTGKETDQGLRYNLREVFGPAPDKVWLSYDYSNIELRIWAYDCGNGELIRCFEEGLSVHLLIARTLFPELEMMSDDEAKATKLYKRTKNGDFSLIYGASEAKANATYGHDSAYEMISNRFPEVRSYSEWLFRRVLEYGFVVTRGGYPLFVPEDAPHKAVSGRVQGTAGEAIGIAMVNCYNFLKTEYPYGEIIMQIHDELVFELPRIQPSSKNKAPVDLGVARKLKQLMEQAGQVIDIPLEVNCELIETDWASGKKLKL